MAKRSGLPALCLALLILVVISAASLQDLAAGEGRFSLDRERLQNWNLIAPANASAGNTMSCSVEIPGPPPPSNTVPPFKVQIMLNGWLVPDPIAHYNYETDTWDFDYQVPSGSNGGVIKIFIHPGSPDIPSISTERKIA